MQPRQWAATSSLRFSLLPNHNFPDHSTRCAGIGQINRAGPAVENGLMSLDLQVANPVDDFAILHDDELMTIGVGNVERVGLFVHRESGAHREMQAAP